MAEDRPITRPFQASPMLDEPFPSLLDAPSTLSGEPATIGRAGRLVAGMAAAWPVVQLAVLAALVLPFWFPWRWPLLALAGLVLLPTVLLVGWRLRGRLTARTGLEAPLVYVLLASCIATVPVVDGVLGLPKILGMVLGAATLVVVGNAVGTRRAVSWSLLFVAGLVLALALIGLVSVEWIQGKLPWLDPLYSRLPVLVRGVVPNTRLGGIHPNELAGVLVLLLPVLFATWLLADGEHTPFSRLARGARGAAAFLGLAVVVLTQSRSGLAGAAVSLVLLGGVGVLAVVRARQAPPLLRVGVPTLWAVAVAVGGWFGWQMLAGWLSGRTADGGIETFEARLELWNRAYYMLQDFPFTGIGLGQFDPVLHTLYVPFLVAPETYVPHAHNLYLEYAVELGIPGAVAFTLLVVAFFRGCWRAIRSGDPLLSRVGLGLTLGMVAFLVYGLTDAIAPGARGGLVLWGVLGLGGAVGNLARLASPGSVASPVGVARSGRRGTLPVGG